MCWIGNDAFSKPHKPASAWLPLHVQYYWVCYESFAGGRLAWLIIEMGGLSGVNISPFAYRMAITSVVRTCINILL